MKKMSYEYVKGYLTEHSSRLNAHHLNGYEHFPSSRLDVNNGITLCVPCHKLFHKTYGNRNNTKEQFEELQSVTP